MPLPLDTYVRIKSDSEALEIFGVPEMVGKIVDYDSFLQEYTICFDAQTLNSFSEDFIRDNLMEYITVDEYDFETDEVEAIERRDTDEQYTAAKARLDRIEQELTEKGILSDKGYNAKSGETPFNDPERDKKIILDAFERSTALADLTPEARSSYVSDADLMLEVAINYFGYDHPDEWPAGFVTEYALGHLPRKLMAPTEEFETIGQQLLVFVQWLYEEEVTDVGRIHFKEMRAAIPKMAAAAADSSNHGIGKSLFSGALADGLDLSDPDQLDKFVQNFNNRPFEERSAMTDGPLRQPAKVVGLDPFRKIGRNDRITVRDTVTGEVQEGVKFKVVEKRLRDGGLELV